MIQQFRRLWFWIFPIDRKKAIKIAAKASIPDTTEFNVYETMPENINVYMIKTPTEPCWYVFAPWGDGVDGAMLRSSRIIIISKKTGCISYDGSANDEG